MRAIAKPAECTIAVMTENAIARWVASLFKMEVEPITAPGTQNSAMRIPATVNMIDGKELNMFLTAAGACRAASTVIAQYAVFHTVAPASPYRCSLFGVFARHPPPSTFPIPPDAACVAGS